ncbi:hypothetical protein JB92DRAFT_2824455 [Gautieria morchelliformis]|nr:hypothetical protein JB92DRAFT_2824455 [Gautieria morchelliformis]
MRRVTDTVPLASQDKTQGLARGQEGKLTVEPIRATCLTFIGLETPRQLPVHILPPSNVKQPTRSSTAIHSRISHQILRQVVRSLFRTSVYIYESASRSFPPKTSRRAQGLNNMNLKTLTQVKCGYGRRLSRLKYGLTAVTLPICVVDFDFDDSNEQASTSIPAQQRQQGVA